MRGRVQGEGRPVADGIQGLIFVEGERDRRGGEVCGDSAGMNRDAIVTAGTVARDAYRSARCPTRRRAAGRMLLGVTHAEHHETTGGLFFSTPVGEDVERRQGGGMFPDYSWVPVGASWKMSVTDRFPKDRKPWNKAENSRSQLSCEVRMMMVVMVLSVSWA